MRGSKSVNGAATKGNLANRSNEKHHKVEAIKKRRHSVLNRFKFRGDYRESLLPWLSQSTGYRVIDEKSPYEPLGIPPFIWLKHIPLEVKIWIFAWIGGFVAILLIEAIMSANTAFQNVYHSPIIITSFGASAVLLFGAIESSVCQPCNCIFGHFTSALAGTCITRLWVLDPRYHGYLGNTHFHANTFVNGGLSMATSLLAMLMTGTVHPPAGATGLNAAVESAVVKLSWRYLSVVLASSLIMLGWAMVVNQLGRRRYPMHWWAPGTTFIRQPDTEPQQEQMQAMEEARLHRDSQEEGMMRRESITSTERALNAEKPEGQPGEGDLNREPPDLDDAVETAETPEYKRYGKLGE